MSELDKRKAEATTVLNQPSDILLVQFESGNVPPIEELLSFFKDQDGTKLLYLFSPSHAEKGRASFYTWDRTSEKKSPRDHVRLPDPGPERGEDEVATRSSSFGPIHPPEPSPSTILPPSSTSSANILLQSGISSRKSKKRKEEPSAQDQLPSVGVTDAPHPPPGEVETRPKKKRKVSSAPLAPDLSSAVAEAGPSADVTMPLSLSKETKKKKKKRHNEVAADISLPGATEAEPIIPLSATPEPTTETPPSLTAGLDSKEEKRKHKEEKRRAREEKKRKKPLKANEAAAQGGDAETPTNVALENDAPNLLAGRLIPNEERAWSPSVPFIPLLSLKATDGTPPIEGLDPPVEGKPHKEKKPKKRKKVLALPT